MPPKEYEIITGIVIAVFVLLLAGFFILMLVVNYNNRKRKYILEREKMRSAFQQQLLQSQLEIQEQTFNDISQEIHDNVGQILSLAKVQINIMTEGNEMNAAMLNDVKNNVGKAMNDLRDIAKSLSNERIKNLTIHAAVLNETERISKSGVIGVKVNVDGQQREMNQQKKLVLFRIVQESMQNIIKHAHATEIVISFHYTPEMLQTIIQDNGKGFEVREAMQNSSGLGLANIKSRAIIAGGRSVIESTPNTGTTITINMPYE